jgi:hypothetical protein
VHTRNHENSLSAKPQQLQAIIFSLWDNYDSRSSIAANKNELGVSTNVGWTFDVPATNFFTATRLPANIAKPVSFDSFAPIRGECTCINDLQAYLFTAL